MKDIAWIGEGGVSDEVRSRMYAKKLSIGRKCHYIKLPRQVNIKEYMIDVDCAIFCRPTVPELISAYRTRGIKIVVDWDDDYWSIPKEHPGYKGVGRGNPELLNRVAQCLEQADLLTFSTEELAKRFERFQKPYHIVPNGWDQDNRNWFVNRRAYSSHVTFGWTGTITHLEDFNIALNPLLRVLKRDTNTRIIIGSDIRIYKLFKDIPEIRKVYYPMVEYEIYPYAIGCYNIFIVPLLDTEFNRAKSDIKLVDAGAVGIPFVASRMPVYSEWPGGGLFANTNDEWYDALNRLSKDRDLRESLGREGHELALKRESTNIAKTWSSIIESL